MQFRKTLAIARWEFLEKVRKTSFLIFTLLFPVIIILLSLLPTINSGSETDRSLAIIALVNFSDQDYSNFEELTTGGITDDGNQLVLVRYNINAQNARLVNEIRTRINSGQFDAALLPSQANSSPILYHSSYLPVSTILKVQQILDKVSLPDGISIQYLTPVKVEREMASASLYSFYYSFSFLVLLAFLTLFTGGTFVRSFLYEKSNGLIELYFSSVSGLELVTGKLFGLILIGLFQISIWIVFGLLILGNTLPIDLLTYSTLLQIIFFILGYIFYSVLFLGAGSVISNEYQAQQVTALLSIIMIFPLITSVEIMSSPNSGFSDFLTFFPLTTAPLAIIRSGVDAITLEQILLALSILIVSISIAVYISAKLFTSSVLIRSGKIRNIKSLIKS